MESHLELSDSDFEHQFGKGLLPPSLFDHEAHIRLAWIFLKNDGEQQAIEKTCRDLKGFDGLHGDGKKFHKTLTVASVKVVHHFIKKSKLPNLWISSKNSPD